MKVSIVMSCFNRAHLLRHSLRSIAIQRFPFLEIVVVNDGLQTDGTEDVCKEFAGLDIKYVFSGQRNQAGLVSRNPCIPNNIAVRQSTGDFIILTCPEIYHVNNVIERLTTPLFSRSKLVTTSDGVYFDTKNDIVQDLPTIHIERAEYFPDRSCYPFCMGMQKSIFMDLGGYDEDFADVYGAEDDDFIWRLKRFGCWSMRTDAKVVHLWHQSGKEFIPDAADRRAKAKALFRSKRSLAICRNTGKQWGVV